MGIEPSLKIYRNTIERSQKPVDYLQYKRDLVQYCGPGMEKHSECQIPVFNLRLINPHSARPANSLSALMVPTGRSSYKEGDVGPNGAYREL